LNDDGMGMMKCKCCGIVIALFDKWWCEE